jgi:ABC-type sugar transport system substrate-binding protein
MHKNIVKVILLLVMLCQSNYGHAKSFKVVFLNPGFPAQNHTGNFWSNVTLFMGAAAIDLDIELITFYAQRNHILMRTMIKNIVAHNPKYVVLVNEKGIGLDIIKQLAAYDIPSFMLLNNLSSKDLSSLTHKEKNLLIGSVIPNNYSVGKKLFNGLVNLSPSTPNKLITLLSLQGDYTTPASLERERGLTDALKYNKSVIAIDNTVANWSKEQAYEKIKGILQHAHIDIIWTANDAMAFGAKKAIEESNIGYPIYIGGINWDIDDPHYPVNLSYGGHVALGAQSLIMLKDIDNNHLVIDERHKIIDIFESSLSPYYKNFTQRLRQNKLEYYNFSRFSLSSAMPLTFSVENLSKAYEEPATN